MMITKSERRTAIIAAAGGVGVLLIYFVGIPLWQKWSDMGDILEPKRAYVKKLLERAAAQSALIERRDALSKKLGATYGKPVASAPGAPKAVAPPAAPESAVAKANAPAPSASPQSPAVEKMKGEAAKADTDVAKTRPKGADTDSKSGAAKSASAWSAATPGGKTPEWPPNVTLAAYVERVANSAGIKLNSLAPVSPARSYNGRGPIKLVGVQTSLEAPVQSLLKLLHVLEKGERLARVNQLEIRRDIKKGGSVTATLQISGYELVTR